MIVVGRGETVTIRVPTHENGKKLFEKFENSNLISKGLKRIDQINFSLINFALAKVLFSAFCGGGR